MRKVIIFGNSGSGKSTYAKKLQSDGLALLSLDTIAWDINPEPVRKPINESENLLLNFINGKISWVIEGCYSDILAIAAEHATEAIFMNLDVKLCIQNAKRRPWEPHKYESKEAQDDNLEMLINWISQYPSRADTFSKLAHEKLYVNFKGKKQMFTSNVANT
ncbi:shikimate kinase [Psychromonas antarctica]|uniref:shikimate kinase n=1 Tax=Psychromonas antarctica TaxID=67573 RepID=UPI001EE820A6|nr:shikimate kinase [Psychromonas antarctica]MCG6201646.1 shikimate kinase [Psychromonas antarctica]